MLVIFCPSSKPSRSLVPPPLGAHTRGPPSPEQLPARTPGAPVHLVDLRGHLLLIRYILREHILAVAVVGSLIADIEAVAIVGSA